MKRLCAVMLLLALLCGCAGNADVSPAPGPSAEAEPESAPEATLEPVPEPTPEPTPTTVYQVQTDYSAYTPYESQRPEAKYTRMSKEWISDLRPSEGYGCIYPFVGTRLYSSESSGISGKLYGFFDQNGRIVADPSYTAVEVPTYTDWDYLKMETKEIPLLILGRGEGENMIFAVANTSGSFVTECKYRAVKALSCGAVCAEDWQSQEFVIYDFEGNVLLTHEDVDFQGMELQSGSYSIGGGEDDIFMVGLCSPERDAGGTYYMDKSGKLIAGPYESDRYFRDGCAIVKVDGLWGVIDTQGNWLIQPEYQMITRGYEGQLVAYTAETGCVVFDLQGNELFRSEEESLAVATYGYYGASGKRYLSNGTLITTEGTNWQETEANLPVIYRRLPDGTTELCNVLSGKGLILDGDYFVRPIYKNFMNGNYSSAAYAHVVNFDKLEEQWLVSWDLKTMTPVHTEGIVTVAVDQANGTEYYVLDDAYYTQNMELAFDYDYYAPTVWNDCFIITDDQASTCYDKDGNSVFCYPLVLPGAD